jgi:hypothetical protein
MKMRVYLSYPFAAFERGGDAVLEALKEGLSLSGFEVIDPYLSIGVGTDGELIDLDLKAIDESDIVVAYIPTGSTTTGMEVIHAIDKGKHVVVITPYPDEPFVNWLKGRGAKVVVCESWSKCWICGRWFIDGLYCESCGMFKCPHCGVCGCNLDEPTRKAVKNEIVSMYGFNPKRKGPGIGKFIMERFYSKLRDMGVVKDLDEFYRRVDELKEKYRTVYEDVLREVAKLL